MTHPFYFRGSYRRTVRSSRCQVFLRRERTLVSILRWCCRYRKICCCWYIDTCPTHRLWWRNPAVPDPYSRWKTARRAAAHTLTSGNTAENIFILTLSDRGFFSLNKLLYINVSFLACVLPENSMTWEAMLYHWATGTIWNDETFFQIIKMQVSDQVNLPKTFLIVHKIF